MGNATLYGVGIAYKDFEIVVIDGGVVTLADGNLITLSAETGATDDLDTITSAWGNLVSSTNTYRPAIFMKADVGHVITIKHQVDNLYIPGEGDVILTENNMAIWLDDGTNWHLFNAVGQAVEFAITNWTEDFALDCDAADVAELCDVFATFAKAVIATGLLGGSVST